MGRSILGVVLLLLAMPMALRIRDLPNVRRVIVPDNSDNQGFIQQCLAEVESNSTTFTTDTESLKSVATLLSDVSKPPVFTQLGSFTKIGPAWESYISRRQLIESWFELLRDSEKTVGKNTVSPTDSQSLLSRWSDLVKKLEGLDRQGGGFLANDAKDLLRNYQSRMPPSPAPIKPREPPPTDLLPSDLLVVVCATPDLKIYSDDIWRAINGLKTASKLPVFLLTQGRSDAREGVAQLVRWSGPSVEKYENECFLEEPPAEKPFRALEWLVDQYESKSKNGRPKHIVIIWPSQTKPESYDRNPKPFKFSRESKVDIYRVGASIKSPLLKGMCEFSGGKAYEFPKEELMERLSQQIQFVLSEQNR